MAIPAQWRWDESRERLHEGWILRRVQGSAEYQRSFAVLQPDTFFLFSDNSFAEFISAFTLVNATLSARATGGELPGFFVTSPACFQGDTMREYRQRLHFFECSTEEERSEWMFSMQQAAGRCSTQNEQPQQQPQQHNTLSSQPGAGYEPVQQGATVAPDARTGYAKLEHRSSQPTSPGGPNTLTSTYNTLGPHLPASAATASGYSPMVRGERVQSTAEYDTVPPSHVIMPSGYAAFAQKTVGQSSSNYNRLSVASSGSDESVRSPALTNEPQAQLTSLQDAGGIPTAGSHYDDPRRFVAASTQAVQSQGQSRAPYETVRPENAAAAAAAATAAAAASATTSPSATSPAAAATGYSVFEFPPGRAASDTTPSPRSPTAINPTSKPRSVSFNVEESNAAFSSASNYHTMGGDVVQGAGRESATKPRAVSFGGDQPAEPTYGSVLRNQPARQARPVSSDASGDESAEDVGPLVEDREYFGPALCPKLIVTEERTKHHGRRLAMGIRALTGQVLKPGLGKLGGKDAGAVFAEQATRIAKAAEVLVTVTQTTASNLAPDTPFQARIGHCTEQMCAAIPKFVRSAIALRQVLDALPDPRAVDPRQTKTFAETAEQLAVLAIDLWQGLATFVFFEETATTLQATRLGYPPGKEADFCDIVTSLVQMLSDVIDSVNRGARAQYLPTASHLCTAATTLLSLLQKAAQAASNPAAAAGLSSFLQEPSVMRSREKLMKSTHALESAAKVSSSGVWPGERAPETLLMHAYDTTRSIARLLGLLQSIPQLWDKTDLASLVQVTVNAQREPEEPVVVVSNPHITSASRAGSGAVLPVPVASAFPSVTKFRANNAILATLIAQLKSIKELLAGLHSEDESLHNKARDVGTLGEQMREQLEAVELFSSTAAETSEWQSQTKQFDDVLAEVRDSLRRANGKWPPSDAKEKLAEIMLELRLTADLTVRRLHGIVRKQHKEAKRLSMSPPPEQQQQAQGGAAPAGNARPSATSATAAATVSGRSAVCAQLTDEEVIADLIFHQSAEGDQPRTLGPAAIKGGSLVSLVHMATWHEHPNPSYTRAFLLTYRSFTDPSTLLGMLADRFTIQPPKGLSNEQLADFVESRIVPVRLRVFNVLKMWINAAPHEFQTSNELVVQLTSFLDVVMKPVLPAAATSLAKALQRALFSTDVVSTGPSASLASRVAFQGDEGPEPVLPSNMPPAALLDLTQCPALEVARQLTIVDWRFFRAIEPREFLDSGWTRKDAEQRAPNVLALIRRSNLCSHWVTKTICGEEDFGDRIAKLEYFLCLMHQLLLLHNFHGAMAINAGLENSAVHRLKHTWDALKTETHKTFEQDAQLLKGGNNFSNLRAKMHSINPPCIPFLGMMLTDLIMIDGSHKNHVKGTDKINFDKRRKIASVIEEVQRYQQMPYVLRPVDIMQDHLKSYFRHEQLDEQKEFDKSLLLEPRNCDPPRKEKSSLFKRVLSSRDKNRISPKKAGPVSSDA